MFSYGSTDYKENEEKRELALSLLNEVVLHNTDNQTNSNQKTPLMKIGNSTLSESYSYAENDKSSPLLNWRSLDGKLDWLSLSGIFDFLTLNEALYFAVTNKDVFKVFYAYCGGNPAIARTICRFRNDIVSTERELDLIQNSLLSRGRIVPIIINSLVEDIGPVNSLLCQAVSLSLLLAGTGLIAYGKIQYGILEDQTEEMIPALANSCIPLTYNTTQLIYTTLPSLCNDVMRNYVWTKDSFMVQIDNTCDDFLDNNCDYSLCSDYFDTCTKGGLLENTNLLSYIFFALGGLMLLATLANYLRFNVRRPLNEAMDIFHAPEKSLVNNLTQFMKGLLDLAIYELNEAEMIFTESPEFQEIEENRNMLSADTELSLNDFDSEIIQENIVKRLNAQRLIESSESKDEKEIISVPEIEDKYIAAIPLKYNLNVTEFRKKYDIIKNNLAYVTGAISLVDYTSACESPLNTPFRLFKAPPKTRVVMLKDIAKRKQNALEQEQRRGTGLGH